MKSRRAQLVVSCLIIILVRSQAQAALTTTKSVASGPELVAAIEDTGVGTIFVKKPIVLEASDFPSTVITLDRNLTIASDPAGPHQVVDFNARDVYNKIAIGPGYNLSIVHLSAKNTRYGPGADVDILASSPGGILYWHDVAKVQSSCAALVKKQILDYTRDPTVPGVNVITFPDTNIWDGSNYTVPNNYSIHYVDFSTRMATGENADRGYIVHKRDSWKLCQRVADPACVAASGAATCVKQQMDEEYYLTHPQPRDTQLSTAAKAGIGVGAAGAVIALAALLFVVWRKKRQQQLPLLPTIMPNNKADGSEDSFEHHSHDVGTSKGRPSSIESTGSGSTWKLAHSSGLGKAAAGSATLPQILRGTLTHEQVADLQLGQMIGAGSYGRVFKGSLGDREVAIKVIHHDSKAAAQVSSEVELMTKFSHPNLVKAFHYVTWGSAGVSVQMSRREPTLDDSANRSSGDSASLGSTFSGGSLGPKMLETWIILEFANAGNLQDAVMSHSAGAFFHNNQPHMGMVLRTLLGIAEGMQWLHSSNVLHGDLKAANVMLSIIPKNGSDATGVAAGEHGVRVKDDEGDTEYEVVPKVADFGLSRVMCEGATHLSTHTVGTITHQPPELMRNGRLSKPADVFSFGVLMWEVIQAAHPWKGKMMGEIMTNVMIDGERLKFGGLAPKAYAALAERCWTEDPAARPTFAQIIMQLQVLLDREDQLQDEVETVYKNVVEDWCDDGNTQDASAVP